MLNLILCSKMKKILCLCFFGLIISIYAETKPTINKVIKYNGIPTKGNIQIYAHRGGRAISPENTIPAYDSSLKIGVDYVDMDIHMTKDKKLIVCHTDFLDPAITRDESENWISEDDKVYVKDLTVEEIQKYDVGQLKPGTDYAANFPYQAKMNHIPMPTLKSIIQHVKKIAGEKVGFLIEVKHMPDRADFFATPKELANALYQIMKEEKIINRTEVQAFNWKVLQVLNKLDPKIKTAYLTGYKTNLDSILSKNTEEAKKWTGGHLLKDYDNSIPKMIKALGGYCFEPSSHDLTKEQLKKAHDLGLKVVIWSYVGKEYDTAFPSEIILKLFNWGVDGIINDRPDELRGFLASRGYEVPQSFHVKDEFKNNYSK